MRHRRLKGKDNIIVVYVLFPSCRLLKLYCSIDLLFLHQKIFYLKIPLPPPPLEVVSGYREPHLNVGETYSHVFNLRPKIRKPWVISFSITVV